MNAPFHLPSIAGSTESAKLPSSYQAAKEALAACEAIDECKDWADRMAALASYAAQAKDEELLRRARRIQARALRRVGELLQQIESARGANLPNVGREGTLLIGRTEAAREAGLSEHQQKQALRLANIPEHEIEDLIESFDPPTITELAEHGTRKRDKNVHLSNNSGSNEWYTPSEIIEAARACMDCIDVDPASSEAANKIVRASTYYTIEDEGLSKSWSGRVWMNPPYGQPVIAQFCEKLLNSLGSIEEACVLVNNATETEWFQSMACACAAICLVKGRVRFLDPTGSPSRTPLQGQTVLYFGNRPQRFAEEFSKFGIVLGRDEWLASRPREGAKKQTVLAARECGVCPVIPCRSNTKKKPIFFAKALYKSRARIEQAFGKLKRFKRVAMRCEKTAQNYASFVALACSVILIKSVHRT